MRTYPIQPLGRPKFILSFTLLVILAVTLKPKSSNAQQDYASIQSRFTSNSLRQNIGVRSEPVVIAGFRTSKRATLRWTGLQENVSHYIIERSFDGENFKEVGMTFTSEDQWHIEYNYVDKFRASNSGRVFYRLKVVYMEGGAEYSPVVILPGFNL